MKVGFLLRGIIIGFSIAAPIGPISILVVRRTLARGRAAGLISSLGAATADAIYGFIAGFGLVYVSNFLVSQQSWMRLVGGIFLIYLGIKTFVAKSAVGEISVNGGGLAGDYASTLFLTLTNPFTILSFAAIFAGLGLADTGGDYLSAGALVAGVFLGSILVSFILTSATDLFRSRFTARGMRWMNRVSGVIIAGFGLIALFTP